MEAIVAIFGALALIILAFIYAPLVWGLVTMKFWIWFVLPVFPGLPILEYWQAVGLYFFIALFQAKFANTNKKEFQKETSEVLPAALLMPWVVLLIGYVFMLIIK